MRTQGSGRQYESAVARIASPRGRITGAGVLVGPRHVLTAAHVVTRALEINERTVSAPSGKVSVSFPLAGLTEVFSARVVHWRPVEAKGVCGDVAGLLLDEPPTPMIRPAPLDVRTPSGFEQPAAIYGFPDPHDSGVWSMGRLRGRQGDGWVQIDLAADGRFPLRGGFSGGPVYDAVSGAVLGIVVVAHRVEDAAAGYMIPAAELLAGWPGLDAPPCPFRGLRPFGPGDADVFHGRGELIDRIIDQVGRSPVITLIGPSGTGKSSVLMAGALTRLRERTGEVVAVLRPSDASSPLFALAGALATAALPTASLADRMALDAQLRERLREDGLAGAVAPVLNEVGGERLLFIIDQFEEALKADQAAFAAFAGRLHEVFDEGSRAHLLIGLRADAIGGLLGHALTAPLVEDRRLITMGEMSRAQLRKAVCEPLSVPGMPQYEVGLAERLLDDVGYEPGRLPLLQFLLTRLWELQEHGVLTHRAYEELGCVDQALVRHADHEWNALDRDTQDATRRLLTQLIWPGATGAPATRRVARYDELDDRQRAAAERLARSRLVVLHDPTAEPGPPGRVPRPTVELAHESLVRHWPTLQRLTEEDRDFRTWQEHLRARSAEHKARFTSRELRVALRWRRRREEDLSAGERGFIRRGVWRWCAIRSTAALTAAAVAVAATMVSGRLSARQTGADSVVTSTLKLSGILSDSWLSTDLAIRAYRTHGDKKTTSALSDAADWLSPADQVIPNYLGQETGTTTGTTHPSDQVSADGKTMITTDGAGELIVWRVEGRLVRVVRRLGNAVAEAVLSGDGGHVLYAVGPEGWTPSDPNVGSTVDTLPGNEPSNLSGIYVQSLNDPDSRPITLLGENEKSSLWGDDTSLAMDGSGRIAAVRFKTGAEEKERMVSWRTSDGEPLGSGIFLPTDPAEPECASGGLFLNEGGDTSYVPTCGPSLIRMTLVRGTWKHSGRIEINALNGIDGMSLDRKKIIWREMVDDSPYAFPAVQMDLDTENRTHSKASGDEIDGSSYLALAGDAYHSATYDPENPSWFVTEATGDAHSRKLFELPSAWVVAGPLSPDPDAPWLLRSGSTVGIVFPERGRSPQQRLAAEEWRSDGDSPEQQLVELCRRVFSGFTPDLSALDLPSHVLTDDTCG